MSDWMQRLTQELEPILKLQDPSPKISAYHDMPYAVFRYPADVEFGLREELALLKTRVEGANKRVTVISLADCLADALQREKLTLSRIEGAERARGATAMQETFHTILARRQPLDALVAERIPADAKKQHDVVFITRAGALFPFYRTSSLLEQLKGKVRVPAVLFYPGELDGAAGLRFMGVLDAEHNYRPKIF